MGPLKAINTLALDKSSVRTTDDNGFLHVKKSHITKATVNPYYGKEIPGGVEHGLDANKIYYGLRDPDELKKSAKTWAGLPLHIEHHVDSADDPQKLTRVGTVGTEVVWNPPYLDAPLTIWDQNAIDGINDDSFRELSCAYRYEPEFKAGVYEGKPYDFVMRNIRGNHVALVEEGRAGPDILVADAAIKIVGKPFAERRKEMGCKAKDEALEIEETEETVGDAEIAEVIEEISPKLDPEELEKLKAAIAKLGMTADADEDKEFAEGVDYGERLERDPEERERLDREHESEGMRAAMDKCGIDAENPAEAKAFAEGVKYGESLEKNPVERKKLDSEHEAEGMEKVADDEEDEGIVEKMTSAVSKLPADKIKELAGSLIDIALRKAGGEGKEVVSEDSALAIRKKAKKDAAAHFKAISEATHKVASIIGNVDPFTFDSADDVYKEALSQAGKDPSRYDRKAWKGMVDILLEERSLPNKTLETIVQDSKTVPDDSPFRYCERICK